MEILNEIIIILGAPQTDVVWSGYDTVDGVVSDLTDHIDRLIERDLSRWMDLKMLFAPTGDLGEIALNSGWSGRYLDIAGRFDDLVVRMEQGKHSCPGS